VGFCVLDRTTGERILLQGSGFQIEILVSKFLRNGGVRLAINCPSDIRILRDDAKAQQPKRTSQKLRRVDRGNQPASQE